METYSIYIGTDIESTSYDLSNGSQFNSILYRLENNDAGEISPIDLRDSILSLWSNAVFKETTTDNLFYIGIDSGNPTDKDIKNKILIGKRSFSGTYSYQDPETIHIMDGLSINDSDIFFYNTKIDTEQQDETKISLFVGTDTSIQMPYISSQYVSISDTLTLNIINNENIRINSTIDRVSINNIPFPKENELVDIDGKIIKFVGTYSLGGYLEFSDNYSYYISPLGTASSELNIYGSEVLLNNYSLEFTDDRKSPIEIGDISYGEEFNTYALTELLKRIIYTYHPPTCSIRLLPPYDSGYVEVGTYPIPQIEYTINKKSLPTLTTLLTNLIPNIYPSVNTTGYSTIVGTHSGIVIAPINVGTQSYTITVSDGVESNIEAATLIGIYPYFCGIGISNSPSYTGMVFLNKKVENKSDKMLQIMGSGNIYYLYPQEHGTLSDILDENNISILSDFDIITYNFSSPSGYWASKPYYIYKSISTYSHTTPVILTFKV